MDAKRLKSKQPSIFISFMPPFLCSFKPGNCYPNYYPKVHQNTISFPEHEVNSIFSCESEQYLSGSLK